LKNSEKSFDVALQKFQKMIRSFLLLLLLQAVQFGTSYTMKEIFQDSLTMNMHELVPFRGPILKDIWLNEESKHHLDRHEEARVCQQLFTKGLETVNVQWPPPKNPPPDLLQAYTMGGKAELVDWYIMVQSDFCNFPSSLKSNQFSITGTAERG
jgi:hypothetical protein